MNIQKKRLRFGDLKRMIALIILFVPSLSYSQNRWQIQEDGSIQWTIDQDIPRFDQIEMSGEKISTVLRYGVDKEGGFMLERSLVWPMLRTIPNNTHASLMRRYGWDIINDMITVNANRMPQEKVISITLNGTMVVVSEFNLPQNGKLRLTRHLFPSPTRAAYCEKYVLCNVGKNSVMIEVPESHSTIVTDAGKGVDGEYLIEATLTGVQGHSLEAGDSVKFYADFKAFNKDQKIKTIDFENELHARMAIISELWSKLVLESPDPVINTMFAFAKIRGAESIFNTKGGYMHGPGGESYYAAIWANDQAEYINPFFPFLGYDTGNQSAYNSFKHFARFMNNEYKPIPSSIISEGTDYWNGAGDRGDGAMIAYGVGRYALANGNRQEALDLWPLLEWCLEYCRRNLNNEGVVISDSDELEGRFPAGNANLATSCLYYDALLSAVHLGEELDKPASQLRSYRKQAKELRIAIEKYFGGVVEGFNTYKYYKENEVLRSWICIPLTVGIYDRKEETIKALFSPQLWTENGLLTEAGSETFWDRSTLYALRGVLACGATEKGINYLKYYSTKRLLGDHVPYAIEAWPEGNQRHLSAESGLYCRVITEGLFGIKPTGFKSFICKPSLPSDWDYMSLKHIQAFGNDFDINVKRQKENIKVSVVSLGNVIDEKLWNGIDVLKFNLP
ncbi:hypothetical protein BA6E_125618 [Bacteroidales bacterium 6E]|nr:hypothetical protein BA6E_125618 [Bacteroidales bacterium 6E]